MIPGRTIEQCLGLYFQRIRGFWLYKFKFYLLTYSHTLEVLLLKEGKGGEEAKKRKESEG